MQEAKPAWSALLFYSLVLLVGACSAALARGIDLLVALVHNLAFLGRLSLSYDHAAHTPAAPWGALTALLPALGALAVSALSARAAPEVEGSGVAEVLEATSGSRSSVRIRTLALKPVAVALSLGTGASVGREGPMVHAAAALGGALARLLRLAPWQRSVLLAAASSAVIAAAYGTALGGALFAIEILLAEVSARTIVPTLLSAATAATVSRLLLRPEAVFVLPRAAAAPAPGLSVLVAHGLLGILLGAVSAAFILLPGLGRRLLRTAAGANRWLRRALAMVVPGLIFVIAQRLTGHYYVEGLGYATIQDVLSARITLPSFLLLLAGLKLLATALSLASGAAGGVFTPALYVGATLGGAWGLLWALLFPAHPIPAADFALSGMAAMVAGATGAPLMAALMILEITGRVSLAIPLSVAAALGFGVRRLLSRESAYTAARAAAGHPLPDTRVFREPRG